MHGSPKQKLDCALYVVATPIGNMGDISLRALDVLAAADIIAAEDTRNTSHLLKHHGIAARKLLALHQHNEKEAAERLIACLALGQTVALVTDAGTPAVSDPGALLVQDVRAAEYRVVPIPGASAALAALSASGMAAPHFLFYGFLPSKPSARRTELQALTELPYTLVFYEAPHRILECTADLLAILGPERKIIFARELTKLFESIHACTLGGAEAWLNSDANNQRGEFVLLVSGAAPREQGLDAEAERTLSVLLQELPLKQAVQLAVKITRAGKNELYQRALELKGESAK
jgi:16S rRNA (cytidine1402-2'-O)-methyltransferase